MDKDYILSELEKLKALILILAEVKDGSYDFLNGCTSSVASYLLYDLLQGLKPHSFLTQRQRLTFSLFNSC